MCIPVQELKATWWPVQSTSGTAVALVCDATISIFTEEDNFERLCRSYQGVFFFIWKLYD